MINLLRKINFRNTIFLINFAFAYVVHVFTFYKKSNSWVFGSGSGLFENNIEAMANYAVVRGESVAFITNKNNKVYNEKIKVFKRGSFVGYLKCLKAKVLFFDDYYSDVVPGFIKFTRGIKVNVNHGQEGLKRLPNDYYKLINCDLTCAVSDFEKKIKVDECGADSNSVFVTGLARYDNLDINHNNVNKDILYFPTWRSELQDIYNFETTEYYRQSIIILKSERLNQILEKHNAKIFYKPHLRMKNIKLEGCVKRVVICDEKDNLTDVIRKSGMLITDYSSIAWDYVYTGRDVIFHQYDIDQYEQYPGMYLKRNDDLFSRRTMTLDDLLDQIDERLTANNKANYDEKFFKYKDKNNCHRIYELVVNMLNN